MHVEVLLDSRDPQLLVLRDHLLVLLLMHRDIGQLLLYQNQNFIANPLSSHLLEVAQDVDLSLDNDGEEFDKEIDCRLRVRSLGLFHYEGEEVYRDL